MIVSEIDKLQVVEVLKPKVTKFNNFPLDLNIPTTGIDREIYECLVNLYPAKGMVFTGIFMELVHLIDNQYPIRPNVLEQGLKNMAIYDVLTGNTEYFEPTPTFQNKFS